ncbi:MAG: hypothetical protein HKM98_06960 [Gammaproteobacteria bacterium]|nr:hypothetical protein [Gammaproteobacteria bacterium]
MRFCLPTVVLVCLGWPMLLSADPLDEAVEASERQRMRWLNEQQNTPGITIDKFRSDGCSGGMSETWTYLAEVSPDFADRVGKRPPWEYCCVSHDRHYWRGESVNGYQKRQQADEELRQCVRQSAKSQSKQLSISLGLSPQEVIEMIHLTADLMHTAVRLGGGPCTGLSWRWGHGWPECPQRLPLETEN